MARSKNSYKGKKNRKGYKPREDREDIMKDRPGKNDISWYGSDVLIKAAGQHNFTNALGKPIDWKFNISGNVTTTLDNTNRNCHSVPGAMALYVEPGIGYCDSAVSPGNVFMRNFYSYIRHANSGHSNYNAPDLGLYVMSIDQVHSILAHLVRIYGVARTYSSLNRYAPLAFLRAMGVDPYLAGQELYPNLASIRSAILNIMVKAGTLLIPKDLKLIERHAQMFQFVYADGSTSKTQTYVFRPLGYKKYVETGAGHTGGYLEYNSMDGVHGIWDWINAAEVMVDAIVQSEDMNIMSGDILKAYGRENCYQFSAFTEDYTVVPVYNPIILLQIHNMITVGNPWDNTVLDIYQDPNLNIIKYTPYFKNSVPHQNISPIIDMPVENPSPEMVVEATRLVTMGTIGYEAGQQIPYKYVPDSMGSEVITKFEIFNFRFDANGDWILENRTYGTGIDESWAYNEREIAHISAFDWHCGLKIMSKVDDTHWLLTGYIGEMENYTPFYEGDLQKLHDTALIGEFAVPLLAVVGFSSNELSKP